MEISPGDRAKIAGLRRSISVAMIAAVMAAATPIMVMPIPVVAMVAVAVATIPAMSALDEVHRPLLDQNRRPVIHLLRVIHRLRVDHWR